MKKRKYLGLLAAVVLVISTVLAGCGSSKGITAEELMDQVSANMEAAESMTLNLGLDMSMSVAQSGVSMELSLGVDVDVETTREPRATHMDGTVSMSVMGLSVDVEQYTVEEDGKTVSYSGSAGEWTRTEVEESADSQIESMDSMFDDSIPYELQEDLEKVDGRSVYVLNGQISGDVMEGLMGDMSDAMEGIPGEGMDWSDFSASVTVKVDQETKMPVEAIFDFSEGFSSLMESAGASEDVDLSIDQYIMTVTYLGFDNVDEIVVPDDVKAAAVDASGDDGTGDDSLESFLEGETGSEEPSSESEESEEKTLAANADGTYTLKCYWGDGSVDIGVPQGYELNPYSDETYLSFTDTFGQDFDEIYVSYILESDYTDEDMESYYMDDISYYQGNEDYTDVEVQEKQTVTVAGRQVSYIKVSYTYDEDGHYVEYYAWTQLADGNMVDCNVEEYAYGQAPALLTDDTAVLETMFSVISE